MRRPAAPAILAIWPWPRSWRASEPVLTATATAQPEIQRRTFSPHVRCRRRALKKACIGRLRRFSGLVAERTRLRPLLRCLSRSRLAILLPSPEGQRPIRNFDPSSARKPHTIRPSGHGQEGKKFTRGTKKKSKAGRVRNLNLLLGAGKNNRNSLSRCPKHAQGKNRSSRDERKRDERGRMCDGRKESVAGRRAAARASGRAFFFLPCPSLSWPSLVGRLISGHTLPAHTV